MRLRYSLLPALAGISLLATGCEPASITEARDQLGRGAARSVTYQMPIARDTFYIDSMLGSDTTRTAAGVRAVTFDPETLDVAVGQQIQFDAVTLDTLVVSVPSADIAQPPGITVSFGPVTYSAFALEPRLLALDAVVAQGGTISITTRNRLPSVVTYTLTLNGFTGTGGAPLSGGGVIPAAPSGGSPPTSHTLVFDLAGVTIAPASVQFTVQGSATSTGTPITPAASDSAIVQTGGGNITIQSVTGTLNPATTPELNVAVEESQEFDVELDSLFGDLKDALKDAQLNDVSISLTVRNGLAAQLALSSFRLGVAELTPTGQVPRDAGGNVVFQKDASGTDILVTIADPGLSTLTVNPKVGQTPGQKTVQLQTESLIDRAVDLLLDGNRAGLVAVGTATASSTTSTTVTRADSVRLTLGITVALDITVPTGGVTFDATEVQDGIDLDSADANQISSRVESASARSVVINQTPFGVQVLIALVPDSQPPGVDADSIFGMPNRVELGPVDLGPAQVNSEGQVTQAVTDTVSVSMTGPESRVLFGQKFTSAVRVTLLPNPTAGGRGAILPTDRVIVSAGASVTIRIGSN